MITGYLFSLLRTGRYACLPTPCEEGKSDYCGIPCRYPEAGGGDTNLTVLTTVVGADYTKLGSFGSAQDFGNNLVVSMDRTYLLRRNRNAGPVQVGPLQASSSPDTL